MTTASEKFAFSRSHLAYRVVHRVREETVRGGHLMSFCRNKPIIEPFEVESIGDLRGARLCMRCFRRPK